MSTVLVTTTGDWISESQLDQKDAITIKIGAKWLCMGISTICKEKHWNYLLRLLTKNVKENQNE